MLARLATRLLLAPLGFTCGLIAGFAVLALISTSHLETVTLFPGEVALLGYDMTVSGWTVLFFLAPLMGAPAIVGVLIAELFAIRSWTYHAVAGAATAVLPWALAPSGLEGPIFSAPEILAAGFVGGLTHWLIAGRSSGIVASDSAPRPVDRSR
jgi:hypothetical protein